MLNRRTAIPRISLYRPERGNDYEFTDRIVHESFTVGGTDIMLHKYLGPDGATEGEGTADQPVYDGTDPTQIQDLLFLENRDRKYDPSIYRLRGIYNVQDLDFNLSQFGLFLDNDTLFLTVHINSSVKTLGRKPIAGDVIELPHLKDPHALNDFSFAIKRFYVIDDVTRSAEGFSMTWYPHLYRLKLKQLVDSQEYRDILDLPAEEDTPGGSSLRDMLSTFEREMQINQAVIEQAEADVPQSGYDVSHYYQVSVQEENGVRSAVIEQTEGGDFTSAPPPKIGYSGYLLGGEFVPNGGAFGRGIQFPQEPDNGDYFLRTDFIPKRLFQYADDKWQFVHNIERMTMTNSQERQTYKTKWYNNDRFTYADLVVKDFVELSQGDSVIETKIQSPVNAKYLLLKFQTIELDFVIDDHPGLLSMHDSTSIQINLPVVDGEPVSIPETGVWEIRFFNHREAERQGLSQALRPQADN